MDLRGSNEELKKLLTDQITCPQDKMDMVPVLDLTDSKISNVLLTINTPASTELAWYLTWMRRLYHLFRDSKEDKNSLIMEATTLKVELIAWRESFQNEEHLDCFINKDLYEETVLTLSNVIIMLRSRPKVLLCSLSTLMVEHFFSTIRRKIKRPNAFEYSQVAQLARIRLDSILAENAPFRINTIQISKCYNNVEAKIVYKALKRTKRTVEASNSLSQEQQEMLDKTMKDWCELFAPRPYTLLLREFFFANIPTSLDQSDLKNRFNIRCPFSLQEEDSKIHPLNGFHHLDIRSCNLLKSFTYHKQLHNHMLTVHHIDACEALNLLQRCIFYELSKAYGSNTTMMKMIATAALKSMPDCTSRKKNPILPMFATFLWDTSLQQFTIEACEGSNLDKQVKIIV